MRTHNTYLAPPPGYRFRRPWYAEPRVYIPAAVAGLLFIAIAIYFSVATSSLKREAATYDLGRLEQMESASVILDRNEKIFGQIYVENRETIPYEQFPRDLVNAIVAAEDAKFYRHGGYDLFGIVRATLKNLTAGQVRQGASTITQQLARNSFALKEKTFRRKLLEIFLARRIEDRFGKQKIMELYLNRIYFGGGLYGAEAAARGYFGKPAREMSLTESATLAGLIKSPNRLSPWSDRNASREARNYVLGRMRDLRFIDRARCASAQGEELVVGSRQNARGQNYAVDYIRQQVIAAVGWDRAMNEGFRIHTTIDSDLQQVAEDSLRKSLDQAEKHPGYDHQTYAQYAATFKKGKPGDTAASQPAPEYLQGAVIAIDNQTGDILALVGGRDFEHNQYDRALQAKRPAGTAMKPFVYAAAFEKGMYPGTVVEDSALDNRAVMIGGTTGILGEWGPENAENRYDGAITARQALSRSKNGATVRIGMNVGLDNVLQICREAGFRSQLRPFPATFLGSSEVTLAELTLAYATFPNGGWRPTAAHIIERIEEKDGTVWHAQREHGGKQNVIKPETAYEVHSCLVDALETGTGKDAHTRFGLNKMPVAGKTGTAYDFTDALFAGYSSRFTCGVWAGFDKPQKIYRGAFGREIALPVWVDIMNAAVVRYPPKEIKQPAGLKKIEICSRSGLLATDKCYDAVKGATGDTVQRRVTYEEIATKEQAPTESCNIHGEPTARLARALPATEFPRASLAVDLKEVTPLLVKTPTLIADKDPYNSARPSAKAQAEAERVAAEKTEENRIDNEVSESPSPNTSPKPAYVPASQIPDPASVPKAIPKAIPVTPADKAAEEPVEIRKAVPVGPLDEAEDEPLLETATPPPLDPDE